MPNRGCDLGAPIELLVVAGALRHRDPRAAKFALEIHLAAKTRFRGPIRPEHRALSLALDALTLLAEERAA